MRLALLLLAAGRAFACYAVDGDWIKGRDLAAASGAFAALDPEQIIAPTPLPGVPRVFDTAELTRLARRNAMQTPELITAVCFEQATEPLSAEALVPALRTALGMEEARIEILDFSRAGVPRGRLQFARAGLTSAGLWRGQVVYGDARSVPVWAKVNVTVERTWVEAAEALPAGRAVGKAQLVLRKAPRFPLGPVALDSIDRVAGREPVRLIKSGEPIFASMLTAPREVQRGDKVKVIVESGLARLELDGRAETAGGLGELVTVVNPDSGKHFQARVEGKDEVVIKK
jgi:flagella basal body P-ring formation protein FlgA